MKSLGENALATTSANKRDRIDYVDAATLSAARAWSAAAIYRAAFGAAYPGEK